MRWPIRIVLALAAAALIALGQPPRAEAFFEFLGLILFFKALQGLTPRFAFWLALATGTFVCGLSVPWLFKIFGGGAPVAMFVIFGLYYALFAAVAAWIAPRISSLWLRALWLASWWTAVEYYRCEWFALRFPWITPGVALGPTWLTPVVGVYGQSFLILLAVALVIVGNAREFKFWRYPEGRAFYAGMALAVFVILPLRCPPPVNRYDPVSVAAVQYEDGIFGSQFRLTREATNSPQLVIWSETAVLYDLRGEHQAGYTQLLAQARASNEVFTVGCYTKIGRGPRDWFNTALTFDGSGVLGEHHKKRLVHFFNDGTRGTNAVAIQTPLGKIGTPICFDCDYTEICRRMTRDGAEFFAVPSRDPSPWGDLQRVQHSMLFRLRAAECGRWFAVASSAGITQIIDPHGNVRASLPPYDPGVLCGTVGREHAQTIYISFGWLLPWILSAFAIIGGIVTVANSTRWKRTG